MTALPDFHARLWRQFRNKASNFSGHQVVDALYRASEKIYAAGIDQAYAGLPLDETLGLAFDLTWLTAVNIELTKIKGKKPDDRQHRRATSFEAAKRNH